MPVGALFSTLGRTAARGLDAALAMIWLKEFYGELMERVKINEVSTFNGERWEPKSWPADAEGVGLAEAPRGALAHWIKIHDGAIDELPTGGADHLERFAARRQAAALVL